MRTKLINLTDRAVIGGLVLLILVTPLCFGTVHPWAYRTAETAVFAMLAATFLRMRAAQPAIKGAAAVLSIAAPAAVLVLTHQFPAGTFAAVASARPFATGIRFLSARAGRLAENG